MNTELEYYLNHQNNSCYIPAQKDECLSKQKYLSEFFTDDEKQVARYNLGITLELQQLKDLLDRKVFELDAVSFDVEPTLGHDNCVISSGDLYRILNRYVLKQTKGDNIGLDEYWKEFETDLNNTHSEINNLKNSIANYDEKLILYQLDLKNVLKCLVHEEMAIYYAEYKKLLDKYKELEHQFNTYVKSSTGGIAVSDKFGNNDAIAISLKTLTEAINNLYMLIAELNGQYALLISAPDFCVAEDNCEVTITVNSAFSVFEKLQIYANGELIVDVDDRLSNYICRHTLDETTTFEVKAVILGRLYTQLKTITLYYPFFIGCGQTVEEILIPENTISYDGNLEGDYTMNVHEDGEKLFIVFPKSKEADVDSILMNCFDIPFERTEEDQYVIYTSINLYLQGSYPIQIKNRQE